MTIEHTLTIRSHRYGDFKARAQIADLLLDICSGENTVATNFAELDSTKRQVIREICDILSRILSPLGDPEYRGNWNDIQGYAKLAEDACFDGDALQQTSLNLDDKFLTAIGMKKPC